MAKRSLNRTSKSIIYMAAGLVVNLTLALVKFFVGVQSGSLTIIMDAINNFIDLAFNVVGLVAFAIVSKRADEEMPFGYGRAEYLASFLLSLFILGTGIYFLYRSINNTMLPINISFQWIHLVTLMATIAVKIGMGVVFLKANRKIRSNVFKGISIDSFVDAAITSFALLGFGLSRYLIRLDAIFGIVISVFFVAVGIKLMATNLKGALGKAHVSRSRSSELEEMISGEGFVESIRSIGYHDYGFGKIYAMASVRVRENSDEMHKSIASLKEKAFLKIGIELFVDIFEIAPDKAEEMVFCGKPNPENNSKGDRLECVKDVEEGDNPEGIVKLEDSDHENQSEHVKSLAKVGSQ